MATQTPASSSSINIIEFGVGVFPALTETPDPSQSAH